MEFLFTHMVQEDLFKSVNEAHHCVWKTAEKDGEEVQAVPGYPK